MAHAWFQRKNGRGMWRPCAWQGWACVLLALGLAVADFIRLDARSHSASDTIRPWVLQMVILGAGLALVARLTSEKPGTHKDEPGKSR
jgi:hypothetical protein